SGEIECGVGRGQLNPSLIREGLTVVDLTRYPLESPFAEESRARGAHYISPQAVFMKQLQIQFKMLTGNELPESAIQEGLAGA
ncbi:MAG TPA: type I 3-dehydroquinate dehydratase, partial [Planctomycetaceae bacterium]|nr:type I 3-dehydroquinate dehydratase [Planctomycetaceae bacterium]